MVLAELFVPQLSLGSHERTKLEIIVNCTLRIVARGPLARMSCTGGELEAGARRGIVAGQGRGNAAPLAAHGRRVGRLYVYGSLIPVRRQVENREGD